MPGIIVFRRRWSVGSDDLFAPASFLVVFHFIWLIVLSIAVNSSLELTTIRSSDNNSIVHESLRIENVSNQILSYTASSVSDSCKINVFRLLVAFLILWSVALIVEVAIIFVSLRGTILEDHLRWPAEYLLYIKLGKVVSF